MNMRSGLAIAAGLTAAVLAFSAAAAEDKDIIDYRQHIMRTMEEQTAVIGMIVSGAAPEEGMKASAEVIALSASIALKSFEAKVQGGKSKPEVWAKWDDFSARMKTFVEKSAALSAVAKKGGSVSELTSVLVEALPCKECHDVYRQEK
jgi:cytochrome c556